jgi:hypothetical protein
MWALYKSGVRFRTIVHEDGTIEHWRSPRLPAWEVPRRDPAERRPLAPEVAAQRREDQRRYRERQKATRMPQQSAAMMLPSEQRPNALITCAFKLPP